MQLDRFLDWFPAEQIMVVTSDQLDRHRTATFARIASFCGVDPDADVRPSAGAPTSRAASRCRSGSPPPAHHPVRPQGWPRGSGPVRERIGARTRRQLRPEDVAFEPAVERWLVDELAPDVQRLERWARNRVRRVGASSGARAGEAAQGQPKGLLSPLPRHRASPVTVAASSSVSRSASRGSPGSRPAFFQSVGLRRRRRARAYPSRPVGSAPRCPRRPRPSTAGRRRRPRRCRPGATT